MRIVWLAPFDLRVCPEVRWSGRPRVSHPAPWTRHLAEYLSRYPDIHLSIVTANPWVERSHDVWWRGILLRIVKSGVLGLSRAWPQWFWLNSLAGYPLLRRSLARAAADLKPDLVHIHGLENAYGLAALHLQGPRVLSVQGIHSAIFPHNPRLFFFWMSLWERRVVRQLRHFGCRTHFDKSFVHHLNPNATIYYMPEAVNPVFFDSQWHLIRNDAILFCGGSNRLKGLDILTHSIAEHGLPAGLRGARIHVVGWTEETTRDRCHRMLAKVGVEPIWHGPLSHEQIVKLMMQCRVYVHPARIDNSPNALCEAMVFGMPIVAFAVGGIPSMVEHEKTGLLVRPGDLKGFCTAIARVLRDDALAVRLGTSARLAARPRHEPDAVAAQTIEVYHQILS